MSAATATKPAKASARQKTLEAVPDQFGGTITIPNLCKPSKVASTDYTRPILAHAYLRKHDGNLWLFTTDSYSAVAVRVDGNAQEGWVPIGALKLIERGQQAEQLSRTSWKITMADGYQVFEVSDQIGGSVDFPNIASLGIFDPIKDDATSPVDLQFGINATLLARVAEGLGAVKNAGLAVHVRSPLKPFRITSQRHPDTDCVGLIMPIRLNA